MKLERIATLLILLLRSSASADPLEEKLFGIINAWREAAINVNFLLNDATDDSRFTSANSIDNFKSGALASTIFTIGINSEVAQREALMDLVNDNGHSNVPLQTRNTLIQQLTDTVNTTLFSINNVSSDDPDFQNKILESQISSVNAIRCNQLMPAIGAFWNQTAEILGEEQSQDLPGPCVCEELDASTFSYPIGGPISNQSQCDAAAFL